jgi:hypothetical protein
MSYKFVKTRDPENHFDNSDVLIRTDSHDLLELLEEFENFLKACGFSLEGHLDIVQDDVFEEEKNHDISSAV